MNESCWDILGIVPTSDESSIKKAYASQLKFNKPDKNPDGFRRLRSAYEQALEQRYWYHDIEEDLGEVSLDGDLDKDDDLVKNKQNAELIIVQGTKHDELTTPISSKTNSVLPDISTMFEAIRNNPHNDDNTNANDEPDQNRGSTLLDSVKPIEDDLLLKDSEFINDSNDLAQTQNSSEVNTEKTSYSERETELVESGYDYNYNYDEDWQLLAKWQAEWQAIYDQYSGHLDNGHLDNGHLDNGHLDGGHLDDIETNTSQQKEAQRKQKQAQQIKADQALYACLSHQIANLKLLPLDTQSDYEMALFTWLEAQPPLFNRSYDYIKTHFDWHRYIEGWSSNEYPWYLMRPLHERYLQSTHLTTPQNFSRYLASHFPLIHKVWDFDLPYTETPSRWQFFRRISPAKAFGLNAQLEKLEANLRYYATQSNHYVSGSMDTDWLNHPQFITLKKRLTTSFIQQQDFIKAIAIAFIMVTATWLLLRQPLFGLPYLHDMVGVYAVLTFALLFWQLQLYLFADPQRFLVTNQISPQGLLLYRWWRNVSVVFWLILYMAYAEIGLFPLLSDNSAAAISNSGVPSAPINVLYFLAHISGLSMMLAINAKNDNVLHIQINWYITVILLVLSLILPLIDYLNGSDSIDNISPTVWLLLILPLLLMQFGERFNGLRFVGAIGEWLTGWMMIFAALGAYLIFVRCFDLLSDMQLGATAFTLIAAMVYFAVVLFKSIATFNE